MLAVTVDPDSGTAVYEQLRTQIAQQINDRTLPVGAKLPTVRAFASEVGIAANTAAKVYRELEQAGLIETRGRSGTFVAAAGERGDERAAQAAAEFARTMFGLGYDPATSLDLARAALDAQESARST